MSIFVRGLLSSYLLAIFVNQVLAGGPIPPNSPEFFETRIRPILANNCYGCHTNSKLGGLRVDSRDALLQGGSSGPSVVPGNPEKSLLIAAVQQSGELKMPKGSKLKAEDVEDLTAWVKAGAVWPASAKPVITTSKEYTISPEQRAFWSYQPLHPTPVPEVAGCELGKISHRSLRPRPPRKGAPEAGSACR